MKQAKGKLSRRDHFAGAAVSGMLAGAWADHTNEALQKEADRLGITVADLLAKYAFEQADAMLKHKEA